MTAVEPVGRRRRDAGAPRVMGAPSAPGGEVAAVGDEDLAWWIRDVAAGRGVPGPVDGVDHVGGRAPRRGCPHPPGAVDSGLGPLEEEVS